MTSHEPKSGCKVDVVIDRYDLDDVRTGTMDDRLITRWKGEGRRSAMGYRTLTDWFNKHVLRRVYEKHGRDTTGPRVDSEYEVLRGDDDLVRQEVIEGLESDDIDAELLQDSLVSWSTMRVHLRDCLNGEKTQQEASTDWERESVQIACERTRDVVEEALSSLAAKDRVSGADQANIRIRIDLSCPECPMRLSLEEALEQGQVCEDHFPSSPPTTAEKESSN